MAEAFVGLSTFQRRRSDYINWIHSVFRLLRACFLMCRNRRSYPSRIISIRGSIPEMVKWKIDALVADKTKLFGD